MTDLYAVVGNPIAHSRSPWIHAQFSRQTGQDMVYEAILAPLGEFAPTVADFRGRGGRGMNVTVPFKLEACALANRLTPRAKAAQAVNTLVFDGEGVLGDNTDGVGLVRDIRTNLGFPIAGKRVLLMGAGGAASGVILPLLEQGPRTLLIANRTRQKAHALQQRFSCHGNVISGDYEDIGGESFDLVINATSASLAGELPPLTAGIFSTGAIAYDMVYGGTGTPFLDFARQHGASRQIDGAGMLVEQAAESFLVWRGVRPETGRIIDRLRAAP